MEQVCVPSKWVLGFHFFTLREKRIVPLVQLCSCTVKQKCTIDFYISIISKCIEWPDSCLELHFIWLSIWVTKHKYHSLNMQPASFAVWLFSCSPWICGDRLRVYASLEWLHKITWLRTQGCSFFSHLMIIYI